MIKLKIPHLHTIKGRWYWIPSKSAKALGFKSQPLGVDNHEAVKRAQSINESLDAKRKNQFATPITIKNVAGLIANYRASDKYADLAKETKRSYTSILSMIERNAGMVMVETITRPALLQTYEKLKAKHPPSSAAAIMRIWRLLMQHAFDIGWQQEEIARKMRIRSMPPRIQVWNPLIVEKFVDCANENNRASIGLAVMLAYSLGQRQTDILSLTWNLWDGATFAIRQSKTKTRVRVETTPYLASILNSMKRTSTYVVVSEATHRPYKQDHFKHEFTRLRALSGIDPSLQFRDLKRTVGTELGLGEATLAGMQAVLGNQDANVLNRHYVVPSSESAGVAQRRRFEYLERTFGKIRV